MQVKELKEKIIKLIEEQIEKNKESCNGYRKSDDVGACYHYKVHPMIDFLEEVKKL